MFGAAYILEDLTYSLDLTSPENKQSKESPIREKSIQGLKPSLGTANCRLLDNFPDHVSFHPCDYSNGRTRKLQFDALD